MSKELENRIAELEAENAAQKQALEQAENAGQRVSLPVKGSYTAKWKNPQGKEESLKVEFKDGARFLRIPKLDGLSTKEVGQKVSTEAILKIANGKKVTEEEYKNSPYLLGFTKEEAQLVLTHFAKIKAGQLKGF